MGACAGCGRAGTDSRCAFCGVALAPRGYAVEKVLAQTDHGRVYRARSPDGAIVALKELQFASVPGAQQIDAFEREAATLKTLHHPRIPRYVDSFSEGEGVHLRLYLAAEFIEGEPLSARIRRGPFPEAELRDVAGQVLWVLLYLHKLGVLHRDIKPDNLIVRPGGELVLVDFGSARQLSGTHTYGSTLVGTFGYMPTEQLGGTVDATSDLYALGATLLHAATGKPPSELLSSEMALRVPRDAPLRGWFAVTMPFCNPLEVPQLMARRPAPPGWDGAGYAAGCWALAGRIDEARSALARVPEQERWRAAGIVFDLAHPVADAGDDIAAAPIMNLVIESWPNHFMALYHAGISDFALGNPDRARKHLTAFLRLYKEEDGFTRNAREALAKL